MSFTDGLPAIFDEHTFHRAGCADALAGTVINRLIPFVGAIDGTYACGCSALFHQHLNQHTVVTDGRLHLLEATVCGSVKQHAQRATCRALNLDIAVICQVGILIHPKSVIRISLCRTAKRNPLIFPI